MPRRERPTRLAKAVPIRQQGGGQVAKVNQKRELTCDLARRPSPALRRATRRGLRCSGVHDRCSDDPLPAATLAKAARHPSALRRETRCQGLGFGWGSSSPCLLGRASRPTITRSQPHQTRPEALYFGYGFHHRHRRTTHVADDILANHTDSASSTCSSSLIQTLDS